MIYDIKQFVLSNGSEIMCEVVDWAEEGFKEIVVRNSMEISNIFGRDGEKFYIFKPWMHYIEANENLSIINSDHVIATANPNKLLVTQYIRAVAEMHEIAEEREREHKREQVEGWNKLAEAIQNASVLTSIRDSDQSNIIQFPVH